MDVELKGGVLRWARERAGFSQEDLAKKLGLKVERVIEWEDTGRLPYSRAQKLAKVTYTPFAQLYLREPPVERLPIPDFRTLRDAHVRSPTPDLLDVVDDTLQRQDWYRSYLQEDGEKPHAFVGSLPITTPIHAAAARVREVVAFDLDARAQARTWEEAVTLQVEAIEAAGVLVMRSGIVRNNTHRPLSVEEFRGFAIADPLAPVIFLNGRDALAAQMFTLAHELVHIFAGATGISNLERTYSLGRPEEQFCNRVAAELLVPEAALRRLWPQAQAERDQVAWLGQKFKVSSLVVLRRLKDLDLIGEENFEKLYASQVQRFRALAEARSGGGDFYRTQRSRASRRFVVALVASALEGRTPYRDAYRLLGISKSGTFNEFARRLGLAA